jgi:hypothetical protein
MSKIEQSRQEMIKAMEPKDKLKEIEDLLKLMQKYKVGVLKSDGVELHLAAFPVEEHDLPEPKTEEDQDDILFFSAQE